MAVKSLKTSPIIQMLALLKRILQLKICQRWLQHVLTILNFPTLLMLNHYISRSSTQIGKNLLLNILLKE
jgi:hypothetical protein